MAKAKTATKAKGEENLEVQELEQEVTSDSLADLTPSEYAAYRKLQRDECGAKINDLLREYGVDLSAKMIIGPGEIVPQVILIDARPQGDL
jgi:hypothetical protein